MDTKPRQRMSYQPPVLKRIELRTEEVLGIGCKGEATPGYDAMPCTAGCNEPGS